MHQKRTFGTRRSVKNPKYQNVRQPLRTFRNRSFVVMTFLWLLAFQLPVARAQLPQIDETDTGILSQLQILQQQIDELKSQQVQPAQFTSRIPPAPAASMGEDEYDSDLPEYMFGDAIDSNKFPTARLTGFFQADAVGFIQDAANIQAVGDVQNGADFRRARLAATVDVWDNVGYIKISDGNSDSC